MLSNATAVQAQKTWVKSNKRKTTNSLANPTKDSNYSREKAAEMSRKADEEARQKAIQDSIKKAEYEQIPEGLFWKQSQRNYIGKLESGYFYLHEYYKPSEHSYGGGGKWILTPRLRTDLATGNVQMFIHICIKFKSAAGETSIEASVADAEIDDCIKALKLIKEVTNQRGDGYESRIFFNSGSTIQFQMKDTGKGWGFRLAVSDSENYNQTYYKHNSVGSLWKAKTVEEHDSVGMDIPLDKIDELIEEFQKAKDILTEAKRKKTAK